MSKDKHPKGWKQTTLGEMMPEPHYTEFLKLWKQHNGDLDAVTRALRAYLQPFKEEFAKRGLVVDYVSYAVPYYFQQAADQQRMQQQADQAHDSMDLANDIMRKMHKPNNPWN